MSINREHKDRLFKMIFGKPEHRDWTLSLYNAVNGTTYEDPSQITFNTMEDSLYMGMKNDVSFVLNMWLNLYEHQSTFNPNEPVRCLMYLGRLWSKELLGNKYLNIYGQKLVVLSVPKFVVLYNGTLEEPDEQILKLSSAFPENIRDQADVELRVRMINVNHGHSADVMDKCRSLYEYAWLIDKIREYNKDKDLEEAIDMALEEMPDDYIIKAFLTANREEVRMSILTEYDEQKLMNRFWEEGREEGLEEGRKEGQTLLVEVITRLNKGESREQILASGVDEKTLELAEEVVGSNRN